MKHQFPACRKHILHLA